MIKPLLVGYTDADLARKLDTRWSTFRFVVTFACGDVPCQSMLEKCVVLSTIKA